MNKTGDAIANGQESAYSFAQMFPALRGGYMRMPGRPGGRTGGGGGVRNGSMMRSFGASRLNGLMMMGGMVGGADGGPFGPPPSQAGGGALRCAFIVELTTGMGSLLQQSRLSV